VVSCAVQDILTDENTDRISARAIEAIEQEATDRLTSLQKNPKTLRKRSRTSCLPLGKGLLPHLQKNALRRSNMKKPKLAEIECLIGYVGTKKLFLTKERIMYWLSSFKDGDVRDIAHKRRIIDALVDKVFVFDEGDKGRRIIAAFNLSEQNTVTISCSDITCLSPPKKEADGMSAFL